MSAVQFRGAPYLFIQNNLLKLSDILNKSVELFQKILNILCMQIVNTIFDSVFLITPKVFYDNRGFFLESYQKEKLSQLGIHTEFVQDNHSLSKDVGTIRGMHFQSPPHAQAKLIRVLAGTIENFIVDIRKNSPTYKQFDSVKLSSENKQFLYIPKGFANGFKTLTTNCEVLYKVDNYYSLESDKTFLYNDTEIGIEWDVESPVLSEKDKKALPFSEIKIPFIYGEEV